MGREGGDGGTHRLGPHRLVGKMGNMDFYSMSHEKPSMDFKERNKLM